MFFKYITIICFLLVTFSVLGQTSSPNEVSKLAKDIALNQENLLKISAALNYNQERIKALMADTSIGFSIKQNLLRGLITERKAKISSVFTAEQLAKYNNLLYERNREIYQRKEKAEKNREAERQKKIPGSTYKRRVEPNQNQ